MVRLRELGLEDLKTILVGYKHMRHMVTTFADQRYLRDQIDKIQAEIIKRYETKNYGKNS